MAADAVTSSGSIVCSVGTRIRWNRKVLRSEERKRDCAVESGMCNSRNTHPWHASVEIHAPFGLDQFRCARRTYHNIRRT